MLQVIKSQYYRIKSAQHGESGACKHKIGLKTESVSHSKNLRDLTKKLTNRDLLCLCHPLEVSALSGSYELGNKVGKLSYLNNLHDTLADWHLL